MKQFTRHFLLLCLGCALSACGQPTPRYTIPPLATRPFPISSITLSTDPIALNGIPLRADLAMVTKTGKFYCRTPEDTRIADTVCSLHGSYLADPSRVGRRLHPEYATLMGVPLKELSFYFYGRELHSVTVLYDTKEFPQITRGLEVRYGPPRTEERTAQNRLGATFRNTVLHWHSGDIHIQADRLSGNVMTGALSIATDASAHEFAKRMEAAARQ
jgi:hypothetical protein